MAPNIHEEVVVVNRRYRPEVALIAGMLRGLLLPAVRRHRGEAADPRIKQLEKDVGGEKARPCEMVVALLFDRIDRGDVTAERFPLALLAAVRARQASRGTRSLNDLHADAAREAGEAFAALALLDSSDNPSVARAIAEIADAERSLATMREVLAGGQVASRPRKVS